MNIVDEVYSWISPIQFHKEELEALYTYSFKKNIAIEIGSFIGQSAYILASQIQNKLFCIDMWYFDKEFDFITDISVREHYIGLYDGFGNENVYKIFKERLSPYEEKLIVIKECSNLAHYYLNNNIADLLFIDGDHSYMGVISDFMNFKNKVVEGGYIIFHDYKNKFHPEVEKAIDLIKGFESVEFVNQVKTLVIFRKIL